MKDWLIRRMADALHPVAWPTPDEEFEGYTQYFNGNVLNAGAGSRDISSLVSGKLYNQDLPEGLHNENIDILSPLHEIPVEDGFFDAILCNAVLEHVRNPTEVVEEFYRVLKPGGYLYLSVPFMQPEHLDPTDYQRYTVDGLTLLVTKQGFEKVKAEPVHTVYHTLGWIVKDWLQAKQTPTYLALRMILYPLIRHRSKHSKTKVHSIASAYRVLARKPQQGAS